MAPHLEVSQMLAAIFQVSTIKKSQQSILTGMQKRFSILKNQLYKSIFKV